MKLITFDEADDKLTWTMITEAMREGHLMAKAEVGDMLLRNGTDSMLNRAAWIDGLGMALKSMTVFPGNNEAESLLPSIQGGVLLFDGKNGSLKAVIDGILVTKWKTAADSVLGAQLLANPKPEALLVVGAGTVARSILDAYREIFPSIRRVTIWNRNRANAEELAALHDGQFESIAVTEDLADACANADIVSSATMAMEPVLKGEWITPGTHVDLIGAFRPDMREADDDLISSGELFVDSRDTTLGHIGELEIPIANGVIRAQDIRGDLYELCQNESGRSSAEAITIFKNGGGAHLDLMTSARIEQEINA